MATSSQISVRRVVPRWRSFKDAVAAKETDPVLTSSEPTMVGSEFLRQKEREWEINQELLFATDLISAAHVLGESNSAKKAAEFVLAQGKASSRLARELAASLLGISVPESFAPDLIRSPNTREEIAQQSRIKIVELKRRRLVEPRNAFVWADLSRQYVLLGLIDQAWTPMKIALALAPLDRFIIRSAVRFYLHAGKPEEALRLLRKSERTSNDPWLISAELAVSSVLEKNPKFTKQAEDIIGRQSFRPYYTSEMTAALASLEMWSGNRKQAKRLFLKSLIEPTENALAQAVWAAREVGLVANSKFHIPNAFEAETLAARNEGHWETAVEGAKLWAKDESFSSRPHALGSSIVTSVLQKPREGEMIAREGLSTNPRHAGLINNVAFALVEQNQPIDAKKELPKADLEKADGQAKTCLLATEGLIAYRLGNHSEGKRLYLAAIALATKQENASLKATAQLYLAREEARIGNEAYFEFFNNGAREIVKSGSPQGIAVANNIRNQIINFGIEKKMVKKIETSK